VTAIEQALGEGSRAARLARSDSMKSETWSARVTQVAQTIDEIAAKKRSRRG